ncbi:MAG TPA: SLBB domain-containing protein, partial [Candidatus Methanoperedens sp.]|nr:SLBB domain-containing protein [Candidatus Methanoperedens sp.]
EYVIGEGDTLQIGVFGHPDLATTVLVPREGAIRFPLLGQVTAAGLTAGQLAAALTDGLADGFIVDPQVSVSVQEYRMKKAGIVGRVNHPGQYEFRGRLTFLELLSRAGGLAADAGAQALVRRKSPAGGAAGAGDLAIDLRALIRQGDLSGDVEILDEDIVTVPEAGSFFLTGEVRRPGELRFEEGMSIVRAITLAGGFSERAVTDRLTVIRVEGERERMLEVDLAAAAAEGSVRRGDIIVVAAARAEVCYVTGEVKNAGAYRCDRDTNVLKAVTLAGGFTDAAARNKIRIVRRVDGREQVRDRVGLEEPVLANDVLVVPKSFF